MNNRFNKKKIFQNNLKGMLNQYKQTQSQNNEDNIQIKLLNRNKWQDQNGKGGFRNFCWIDKQNIATCDYDNKVKIWECERDNQLKIIKGYRCVQIISDHSRKVRNIKYC